MESYNQENVILLIVPCMFDVSFPNSLPKKKLNWWFSVQDYAGNSSLHDATLFAFSNKVLYCIYCSAKERFICISKILKRKEENIIVCDLVSLNKQI